MNTRPLWERTCPRASGFGAHRIADRSAPTVPCDLTGETAALHPVGPGLSRPTAVGPGARYASGQRGMTLVELIIAIVIVGIAAVALYTAMASISARSADPMLRQQSLAIAEAYLEEILAQHFLDPANQQQCPPPPLARVEYDNVCDYAGLDEDGARDASGTPIAGLQGYRVRVTVTPRALSGLAAGVALHVRVSVRDPGGQSLGLEGWRTCYAETDAAGAPACTP